MPVKLVSYYFNAEWLNPALFGIDSSSTITLSNQFHPVPYNVIRTFYGTANLKIGRNINYNGNNLHLTFYDDREGEFLHRNRILVGYTKHLRLNKLWSASLGAVFGWGNFRQKGNNQVGDAVDGAITANAGFSFYSAKTLLGISVNQLEENEIIPLGTSIVYKRHYNLLVRHRLSINMDTDIRFSGLYKLVDGAISNTLDLMTEVFFRDIVGVGVNYQHQRNMGFLFGVKNITFDRYKFDVQLAYSFPFSNSQINQVTNIEVGLKGYF